LINFNILSNKKEMGGAAADRAAIIIQKALKTKNKAYIIVATGVSQFEFLDALIKHQEIDWSKVEMFHLDEYIGLSADHSASFRHYLKERFVDHINLGAIHFIDGDVLNPVIECERISNLISKVKIDLAFVGIGENGHLAFNDPPADFKTTIPYIMVNLDERCRKQQVGEGWFSSINEVPNKAISMSINEILRAENIICICPDKRKAEAVRDCLSEKAIITPDHPASILKKHERVYCYLDKESASLL
jgi:glucosamine-6-phosphate deaminase